MKNEDNEGRREESRETRTAAPHSLCSVLSLVWVTENN